MSLCFSLYSDLKVLRVFEYLRFVLAYLDVVKSAGDELGQQLLP